MINKVMEILDFIPKYPNIHNYSDNIFNPYVEDLNLVIFKKKEFYDERLPKIEPFPEKPGDQMKHQKIIARFFSSRTMYDQLLLLHGLGTGKTCASIAAIEQIRSENSTIKGAIICAKGEALLRNFINELVNKCTAGQYKDPKSIRINNKKVKEYYSFETYETFAKELKGISNKTIEDRFSNRIIVLDEVHNLRLKKKKDEDLNIYNEFWRLSHYTRNTKLLLLSGTPMTDTPYEIANILNLMLPIDEQLPTGKEFMSLYFNNVGEGLYEVKPEMKDNLKFKMKGRVSYLNAMSSQVNKVFVGNGDIEGLSHFILYQDYMSNFQSVNYTLAYDKDTKTTAEDIVASVDEKSGLYKNSRQASLFVFPDGSYGSTGFNKYISTSSKISIVDEGKNKVLYNYSLKPELIKVLNGKTIEEKLNNLQKYSSKYADTIKNILLCQEEGKCVFVYSELVKGSGLILFSKILEQIFGFKRATGNETSEEPRYAIISNETTSQAEIINLLRRFNQPDNMRGKYINVIMGSKVISEGITLNNIQSENILTTWWNYTQISQAIGRGYRLGSHRDLIKVGIIPEVKVYQRVSVTDNGTPSIDIRMYSISEIKDINIKQVERLIKEAAFDCALNYNRNYTPGYDGERECDYMECEYTCDGIPKELIENGLPPNELYMTTYQLYYSKEDIQDIISQTINLFKTNFTLDLKNILSYFKQYSEFEVLCSLRTIINNSYIINNKFGFPSYLKEDKNNFFLVNSLTIDANYLSGYYIENTIILNNKSYDDIVNKMYLATIPIEIKQICTSDMSPLKLQEIISKFPVEIQQLILENTLVAEKMNIETNKNLRKNILEYYKNYYYEFNGVLVSDLLYEDTDTIRCLNPDSIIWEDCSSDEYLKLIEELKNSKKKSLESSEYGYYGQLNKKNNEFCLRDVSEIDTADVEGDIDKRKLTSGKRCINWDRTTLTNIVACKLKVPVPNLTGESLKKYQKLTAGKSKIELWDMVQKSPYTKDCYENNEQNYNNNSEEDLKRVVYWSSVMRKPMCSYLMEWFRENNLLDEKNATCGINTKKKS
jgi:superfamily II DNA or RNA helicase